MAATVFASFSRDIESLVGMECDEDFQARASALAKNICELDGDLDMLDRLVELGLVIPGNSRYMDLAAQHGSLSLIQWLIRHRADLVQIPLVNTTTEQILRILTLNEAWDAMHELLAHCRVVMDDPEAWCIRAMSVALYDKSAMNSSKDALIHVQLVQQMIPLGLDPLWMNGYLFSVIQRTRSIAMLQMLLQSCSDRLVDASLEFSTNLTCLLLNSNSHAWIVELYPEYHMIPGISHRLIQALKHIGQADWAKELEALESSSTRIEF